ncbi:MAG TPA: MmcQ/YjbR family DNA-binding protein [Rhizomicrobium sp.]
MRAKKVIGYSAPVKALAAFLAGKTGAATFRYSQNVTMYKVMNKTFAIMSMQSAYVVLKCDPNLIDILKATYSGVGHKTHLDRRHWIAVELNSDVPLKEAKRLASLSYELVRNAAKGKPKRAPTKTARRVRTVA